LVLLDQTQDLLADLPEQVVLVAFVRQVEQLAVEQVVLVVELLPLELEQVQVEPLELAVAHHQPRCRHMWFVAK